MATYTEAPTKTFQCAGALGQYLRVVLSGGYVSLADATASGIGTMESAALAAGSCTVRLCTAQGTRKMVASDAITAGNPVYAAAAGKVAPTGTVVEGKAMEASTTDGDVIEVLPIPNTDLSAATTGTTAVGFLVDSDSSTPKIKLMGQAAGTGNFTTTLKPESTLSGDNAIIVPEADGDTLAAVALAQTLTNKTLTSPVLTTPQINDASSDHQYVFAGSELAADRTVTLPILTAGDTFVFAACSQALSNKSVSDALLFTAGAAAYAVAQRFGQTATEGLEIRVIDEDVTLTNAVENNLTQTVPAGAVILSVQGNLETAVTGDASGDNGLTKVGIGLTGDPNKYGLTADLNKNTKIDTLPDWAVLSGAETVCVKAADNDGAAVTEKFTAGGIVRVRIVYLMTNSLDNAA